MMKLQVIPLLSLLSMHCQERIQRKHWNQRPKTQVSVNTGTHSNTLDEVSDLIELLDYAAQPLVPQTLHHAGGADKVPLRVKSCTRCRHGVEVDDLLKSGRLRATSTRVNRRWWNIPLDCINCMTYSLFRISESKGRVMNDMHPGLHKYPCQPRDSSNMGDIRR